MSNNHVRKTILVFALLILPTFNSLAQKSSIGVSRINHTLELYQQEINNKKSSDEQPQKFNFLLSSGINISSFRHEEGSWQLGYSFGLTFNIYIYRNLSMTLPFSYTRISASSKNVEGRTFPNIGENIYGTLSDWQVSVGFIELPVFFTYKFVSKSSYDIRYVFGTGVVVAKEDLSRIENFRRTDEIIGIEKYAPPLEPQNVLSSGFNISTGFRFHISQFYIDLLYSLYPYEIKEINKLHSISLRLGIDIS
jgi:hypothetical protein